MDLVTDDAVRKALADMGTACVQMLSVQGGICGEQLSVGIVNQPNLLCDRFLVGTCNAGHQRLVSIVE